MSLKDSRNNRWQQAIANNKEHDPSTTRFDLMTTVRSFLNHYKSKPPAPPRVEAASSKRDKGKEVIPLEQTFANVIRIAGEDHIYWSDWEKSVWTIEDIADAARVISIHELQSLSLHGKAIWILQKILQHSHSERLPIASENHAQVLNDAVEVLFEVAITQTAYIKAITALQLLVDKFQVSAIKIFDIGKFFLLISFPVCLVVLDF